MNLSNDLREFVELLNSTGVNYLLVGGHAVAFHGYPRFTGDIDLLTSIDGVDFDLAWANKVTANLAGLPVSVIGKAELIANKHAIGRAQDLADLKRIEDKGG